MHFLGVSCYELIGDSVAATEARLKNLFQKGLYKIKLILFKLNSVRSGCPISRAQGSCIKCSSIPDRIGIQKCWFLRREENRSTQRKTSRSREENQQQTQPTYDVESGNRTRATLVEGECSHHCAIPAPLKCYAALFSLVLFSSY